ncbi:hypothetical protein L1049_021787 [Liquidambar formosana]|uniref:Uncharacterized protein n=1 Tax=Liquidambar formosana TaxID=63359 RepID=A0AAP0WPN6_LIQFO
MKSSPCWSISKLLLFTTSRGRSIVWRIGRQRAGWIGWCLSSPGLDFYLCLASSRVFFDGKESAVDAGQSGVDLMCKEVRLTCLSLLAHAAVSKSSWESWCRRVDLVCFFFFHALYRSHLYSCHF